MKFRSDMTVELIDSMGHDQRICQAARVSTKGADSFNTGESEGLINFLVGNRHGSPFEHVSFTWMIGAPIFVWRELMRHRIASYSEESGRYKQLEPVFYVPGPERKLRQIGKTGAYEFVAGTEDQQELVNNYIAANSSYAYNDYAEMLEAGIAKEVARMILPLNIYSSAYVTMNLRGLMNFLSLRTKSDEAQFKSFPQAEIEAVARQMEESFKQVAPLAYSAFNKHGRVQP